jgi:hypothetical protein
MNGHTLNAELVEKSLAYYARCGRKVDDRTARVIGEDMIAEGFGFETATDAAECYRSRIWNAGCVR